MLINDTIPTIVIIYTYMSIINFMYSWDDHGKGLYEHKKKVRSAFASTQFDQEEAISP